MEAGVRILNGKLRIVYCGKRLKKSEELSRKIEEFWEQIIKEKDFFYNGPVFSVARIKEEGAELAVELEETDYAHYLYTKSCPELPLTERCRTLAVGSLIQSADDKIILGISGKRTETEGIVQFIGGGLDPKDICGNEFMSEWTALRELGEEAGDEIGSSFFRMDEKYLFVNSGQDFYGLMFEAFSKFSAADILEKFTDYRNTLEQAEIAELIIVERTKEAIMDFINSGRNKPESVDETLKMYALNI